MSTPTRPIPCIEPDTPVLDERDPYTNDTITEPPQISKLVPVEPPLGAPPRRHTRRYGRRQGTPLWFLSVDGACFKCKRYVMPQERHFHYKHLPGPNIYEYKMLRVEHKDQYVDLLHKFIIAFMSYFQLPDYKSLLEFLVARRLTIAEPHKPTWSSFQRQVLQTHFN